MNSDLYWVLWPDPGEGWGASGPYPTWDAAVTAQEVLFGSGSAEGMTIVHGPVGTIDQQYAAEQIRRR